MNLSVVLFELQLTHGILQQFRWPIAIVERYFVCFLFCFFIYHLVAIGRLSWK